MASNIIEVKNLIITAEKSNSKRISKKAPKDSWSELFFIRIEDKFKKISN